MFGLFKDSGYDFKRCELLILVIQNLADITTLLNITFTFQKNKRPFSDRYNCHLYFSSICFVAFRTIRLTLSVTIPGIPMTNERIEIVAAEDKGAIIKDININMDKEVMHHL